MLTEVMRHCRNHFSINRATDDFHYVETGLFELKDGTIRVKGTFKRGQYIAIVGSILNDGVYKVHSVSDGVISLIEDHSSYPNWLAPINSDTAYSVGAVVAHLGKLWVSLRSLNIIEPGADATTGHWWDIVAGSDIQDPFENEIWSGSIYSLVVPKDFIQLVQKITEFVQSQDITKANLASASFGIQSVSFTTDSNGAQMGWKSTFSPELFPHKRSRSDIRELS